MNQATPIIETRGITKSFGSVEVLRDIAFNLHGGEIHGLIGENGAGKSTLAKIMAGIHQPDAGKLLIDGKETTISNPSTARDLGIALIHQEPLSFPDLDVSENIFVGNQPKTGRFIKRVDWQKMVRDSRDLLDQLGVTIDPQAKMRGLSIADQQMVDMASALSKEARVILMDEPTASLTPSEVDQLFTIMRRLRDNGAGLVFVSHRLEEVLEICDRITVLRDGELVGERTPQEVTSNEIIRMMVGRSVEVLYEHPRNENKGEQLLRVEGLTRRRKFTDITFDVRAGEIVGMAGLVGSGRTDVARALFGIQAIDSGAVHIDGREVKIKNPRDALELGMVYVPEDRQHHGLLMSMSVAQNGTMAVLRDLARAGWINDQVLRDWMAEYVNSMSITLRHVDQTIRELSGGNQQKVVLSKWLMAKPRIMILDEPTRGIDVGAKAEIHRLMGELTQQGIAILMISSELPEVLAMSERIVVMREGRITAVLDRDETDAEQVMAAATGQEIFTATEQPDGAPLVDG